MMKIFLIIDIDALLFLVSLKIGFSLLRRNILTVS